MRSILIKNGFVIDGADAPGFVGDLLLYEDRIAVISKKIDLQADMVIDAQGLIVSPGFIDSHVHSDVVLLSSYSSWNALEQGITTQINGHCGGGPAPVHPESEAYYRRTLPIAECERTLQTCREFRTFAYYAKNHRFGTNMAFYAPQGNIRAKIVGYQQGKASSEQITEMQSLLCQAMECGFLGMSTGLIFAPSSYADTDELVALASVLKKFGGRYTSHIRGEGSMILKSVAEIIEIARRAEIPAIISHLKIRGNQSAGRAHDVLALIDKARHEGIEIYADQYPYTAGCAGLIGQIPPSMHQGGSTALLARLEDPDYRNDVESAIFNCLDDYESNVYQAGYEGTLIAHAPQTPQYHGKTIAQVAEAESKRCIDVYCDLLVANKGEVTGIYFAQPEEDMKTFLSYPLVMGCTDAGDLPEQTNREAISGAHPRAVAAFVRRLALQRDSGNVPIETAIHRITGLPAKAASLDTIGILKPGMRADICIFDWAQLRDHADYEHPFRKNEGIKWVLVGGAIAVREGTATGIRNGEFLSRGIK